MLHAAFRPDPRLAPWVESLWVQDEPAVEEPIEPTVLLPVGHASLVLEYGEPFELVRDGGAGERMVPAMLAGQRSMPARVRSLGRTGLVIVNFRPWGAAAFFGAGEECADRFVALDALCEAARVRQMLDELCGEQHWKHGEGPLDARARCVAAERFLLARLPAEAPDPRVLAAVRRIHAHGGSEPVARVADELGLGRRHLARLFARSLGLAPKVFARVVRFQAALRAARAGESWARVAAATGYHDQAHLVKDCAALAGCTPSTLLAGLGDRAVGREFNSERAATYL